MVARRFLLAVGVVGLAVPLGVISPVHALAGDLFFSEYIEGSSNNKALEIFNGTGASVNLAAGAYNVQMFFNGSASAGLTINLTGTVAAGDVYVVAQSSAVASILAQADQISSAGWFNGDDAVVLRKGTTALDVIGQIGFDPGTEWGTGLTSTADNTLVRKNTICAGDPNGGDAFDPSVEWDGLAIDTFTSLGSHSASCGGSDAAPQVTSTSPANGAGGVAVDSNVSVTFSEPVTISPTGFDLSCTTSGTHAATVSGGPTTFTLDPSVDFASAESCTLTVHGGQVSDQDADDPPDAMDADYVATFNTETAPIPIHDIQQATHRSSLVGSAVTTTGIVTAKASNGFYLQDPDAARRRRRRPRRRSSSSRRRRPTVQVGDARQVSGTVSEFRPGGATPHNLTTTEITGPSIVVQSSGNPLPAADRHRRRRARPADRGDRGRRHRRRGDQRRVRPGQRRHRLLREPRGDARAGEQRRRGRADERLRRDPGGRPTTARTPACAPRAAGSSSARPTSTPSGSSSTTRWSPARPLVNVGDRSRRRRSACSTTASATSSCKSPQALDRRRRRPARARSRRAPGAGRARRRHVQRREPRPRRPARPSSTRWPTLIVNNLRSPDMIALEEIQDNNGADQQRGGRRQRHAGRS